MDLVDALHQSALTQKAKRGHDIEELALAAKVEAVTNSWGMVGDHVKFFTI